jgi:hypothetical protein
MTTQTSPGQIADLQQAYGAEMTPPPRLRRARTRRTADGVGTRARVLDDSFPTMGTFARVVRDADGGLDVPAVFAEIERRLSRFDPAAICRA